MEFVRSTMASFLELELVKERALELFQKIYVSPDKAKKINGLSKF